MLPHCLLPALLLIAAVDFTRAEDLPPYLVSVVQGNSSAVRDREQKNSIPEGQCYGVLNLTQQPALKCPDKKPDSLEVKFWDYEPSSKIEVKSEDELVLTRLEPCKGNAVVEVKVSCPPP